MITLKTPAEIGVSLAQRVRELRLQRGWSQAELARRAGLKLPTYVLFERTGQVSLLRFIAVLDVLGLSGELEQLGARSLAPGLSLAELAKPLPKRGRTRR